MAQLTAAQTKRRASTPEKGKENATARDSAEEDEPAQKRPNLTLNFGIEEDQDDSELPAAPTPSALFDDGSDDGQPTFTFRSIDFANATERQPQSERLDRRRSRVSFAPSIGGGEEDSDADVTAEIGRRAVSEGPTERLTRYSFGSIRMSDFGPDLEVRRDSDLGRRLSEGRLLASAPDDTEQELQQLEQEDDAETMNLRRIQYSPYFRSAIDALQMAAPDEEDTFRLDSPPDNGLLQDERNQKDEDDLDARYDAEPPAQASLFVPHSAGSTRQQTAIEKAAAGTASRTEKRRRKPLKLTRHGTTVPTLPSSFIKRIAMETQTRLGKRKPALSREHVKALEQATEWFFEQVGEDLEAYANHGRNKKRIDESDVFLLMKRQRVSRGEGQLIALAEDFLTRAQLSELDLPQRL